MQVKNVKIFLNQLTIVVQIAILILKITLIRIYLNNSINENEEFVYTIKYR